METVVKDAFCKALTQVIDDNSFLFNWLLLHTAGGSMNCISSIAKWQLRLSRCSLGCYPLRKQMIISFISNLTHKELRGLCHLFEFLPHQTGHAGTLIYLGVTRRTRWSDWDCSWVEGMRGANGVGKAESLHLEYLSSRKGGGDHVAFACRMCRSLSAPQPRRFPYDQQSLKNE